MLGIFQRNNKKTVVIGVAGSKGKTTLTHILHHIFETAGNKSGYLSSNGLCFEKETQATPNADQVSKKTVQRVLSKARKELEFFILEMNSNNVANKIYDGIEIDGGVETNIHDDYQKDLYRSFDHYSETKIDFINLIKQDGFVVLNNTDTNSVKLINRLGDSIRKTIYSTWVDYEKVYNPRFFLDGMSFFLEDFGEVKAPISAQFNLILLVKAITVAQKFVSNDVIQHALDTLPGVWGRFHFYRKNPDFIIIDKARSLESLDKSMSYISKTKPARSKIITIIGSNDKDHELTKSGKIASENSDIVILTSLDSDSKKVFDINNLIHRSAEDHGGVLLERFGATDEYSISDKQKLMSRIEMIRSAGDTPFIAFDEENYTGRLDAIKLAVLLADPGDVIYITGKGNDSSIKYHHVDYEWSDYEAVRIALQEKAQL